MTTRPCSTGMECGPQQKSQIVPAWPTWSCYLARPGVLGVHKVCSGNETPPGGVEMLWRHGSPTDALGRHLVLMANARDGFVKPLEIRNVGAKTRGGRAGSAELAVILRGKVLPAAKRRVARSDHAVVCPCRLARCSRRIVCQLQRPFAIYLRNERFES